MKNIVLVTAAAVMLSASGFAVAENHFDQSGAYAPAQSDGTTQHKGPYVTATVGTAAVYATVGGFQGLTSHSVAWSGAVGYNTSPTFALEGGVDSFSVKNDISGSVNRNKTATLYMPYGAAKFIFPIMSKFALNLKLGITYLSTGLTNVSKDADKTSIVLPYTGVGASYQIMPNLDFEVHYEGLVYIVAGAGQVGAGVTYHF